ncbi:CaiB/BaiF CoA transferase family protein [Microbacterium sp.]|uniref:CaiB/BaiF CoA transferase family protein n=1 Tax=Microbacterium sp. TaxID=51671 RepID=UPI003A90C225
MSALSGLVVVDLTRYLSGPTLTMMLADLGADVIKVEALPAGDPARESGPFTDDGESVYFMASNRNKRSIAVDLRDPEGIEIVRGLIDRADVFVQNFRPGTADAMGLDEETLRARNPGLIYVNISGFGMTPPGSGLPGFDQTAQALSGLMSVTGTAETGPLRVGIALCDSATGVFAAVGVLTALYARERTGIGTRVDASLMESTLSLLSYQAQKYLSLGIVPGQDGNDHPIMFPQGTFKTRGGAITLASGNEKMWRRLAGAIGMEELTEDPRFRDNAARMANRTVLRGLIEEALQEDDAENWMERIMAAGVPCSQVWDVGQALDSELTRSLGMVAEVTHATLGPMSVLGQGVKVRGSDEDWLRSAPPLLGQHSREIVESLGLSQTQISELFARGAIQERLASTVR